MFGAYRSLINRYKAEKELAQLNYKPDFNVGLAYTFREPNFGDTGTDFAGLEFSMTLPVYRDKRDAAVGEAEASLRMAIEQEADFRRKVEFAIHDSTAQLRKNFEQAKLYETGIIPQARQVLEASMTNYQVGKIDFLALLDNIMTIYNYELEYYKVLSEGHKQKARVDAESAEELARSLSENRSRSEKLEN